MLRVHKVERPNTLIFLPVAMSVALLFLIQGIAFMGPKKAFAKVNFPLITLSSFSASGDRIVFAQKYFNRVQVYDSNANFLSGFSLRGSSSSFHVVIVEGGQILDCTPKGTRTRAYDIYASDGKKLNIEITKDMLDLCQNPSPQTILSDSSEVSVEKNFLGYEIKIHSRPGSEELTSSQSIVTYAIAKILYLPVSAAISFFLILIRIAHSMCVGRGEK